MVVLELLAIVQEAPELFVHHRARPLWETRFQGIGVTHKVCFLAGEQVVREASKYVDHGHQEHARRRPGRETAESPDDKLQLCLTLRAKSRRGIAEKRVGHWGCQRHAGGRRDPGHCVNARGCTSDTDRKDGRHQGDRERGELGTGMRNKLMPRERQAIQRKRALTSGSLRHGRLPARRDSRSQARNLCWT